MAETLGPYTLERRIGSGGMADVFLARGPAGVCVVKRPHPQLATNPDFIRMFLDEASLLAQLTHPGIARVFDLGHQGDVYYLAMEYVPGFDLMTISLEYERQGEFIAPELAARVVADAAAALHDAHEAKGARGQPLNIVHRDVSPHNILVSTAGAVKLIDFGVARQSAARHRTAAGLVKGKYPYMAPEQISGQPIDRRADVYALGLVLYELLTNARAIQGEQEIEQIDNARLSRIRPIEQLRPNVPESLRRILAGCLHPEAAGRYATAQKVQLDLETWLRMEGKVVGQEDLLRLFRVVAADPAHQLPHAGLSGFTPGGLTPSDLARATTEEVAFPYGAPGTSAPGLPGASGVPRREVPLPMPSPQPVSPSKPGAPAGAPLPLSQVALPDTLPSMPQSAAPPLLPEPDPALRPTLVPPPTVDAPNPFAPAPAPARRSNAPWIAGGAAVLVLAAVAAFWLTGQEQREPVAPATLVAQPPSPAPAPAPPAPPPEPQVAVQPPAPGPAPRPDPAPRPTPPPAKKAELLVSPALDAEILLDGVRLQGGSAKLEPGKHTVVLKARDFGFQHTATRTVKAGEVWFVAPNVGELAVEVSPFGTLRINGVEIFKGYSAKTLRLWEGRYQLEAENQQTGQKLSRTVAVQGGQVHRESFNLLPPGGVSP